MRYWYVKISRNSIVTIYSTIKSVIKLKWPIIIQPDDLVYYMESAEIHEARFICSSVNSSLDARDIISQLLNQGRKTNLINRDIQ